MAAFGAMGVYLGCPPAVSMQNPISGRVYRAQICPKPVASATGTRPLAPRRARSAPTRADACTAPWGMVAENIVFIRCDWRYPLGDCERVGTDEAADHWHIGGIV